MPTTSSLDAKDKAILYCLDQDARQANSIIAKKTRLSKEVVNYRIKRLVDQKIIRSFYAIIDNSKLGYMVFRVFIRFQGVDIEKEKEILQNNSNIDIGNCSVSWKLSKTPSNLKNEALHLVNSYMKTFENEPEILTYDNVDLETMFYRWLYEEI